MISATKKWLFLKISSVILIPLMLWFIINFVSIYDKNFDEILVFLTKESSKFLLCILMIVAFFFSALHISEIFEDYVHDEKIKNIYQIKGDFNDKICKKKIIDFFGTKVDVVISDMAVNTTGNKNLDSIYTGELCIDAMQFSKEALNNDGKFISKIFMGSTFNEIVSEAKKIFQENKVFKPLSSRKESKESFIICKFLR